MSLLGCGVTGITKLTPTSWAQHSHKAISQFCYAETAVIIIIISLLCACYSFLTISLFLPLSILSLPGCGTTGITKPTPTSWAQHSHKALSPFWYAETAVIIIISLSCACYSFLTISLLLPLSILFLPGCSTTGIIKPTPTPSAQHNYKSLIHFHMLKQPSLLLLFQNYVYTSVHTTYF